MAGPLERDARAELAHRPAPPALHRPRRARLHPAGEPLSHRLRQRLGRLRPSRLELISLHLPKTAGTSFREALFREYGADLAAVYDGARPDGRAVRAVHGHFSPDQFWSAGRRAKLIMWLRDPVDRLASYYDFWLATEPHGNPNHDEFLARELSLVEFADWAPIRDEFSSMYVPGLEPDDFFFLGVSERYEQDLARLAGLLDWSTSGVVAETNVTPGERSPVDDATRRAIERIHATELRWYRQARAR